jgi:hypothetical protein
LSGESGEVTMHKMQAFMVRGQPFTGSVQSFLVSIDAHESGFRYIFKDQCSMSAAAKRSIEIYAIRF